MKYCNEQGCKTLVETGRYCSQHQRRNRYKYTNKNRNFYQSRAWKDLKAYCYERDGGRCVRCKQFVFGHNAQHHHIVPINVDASLKLEADNIQTLCPTCHMIIEHGEKKEDKASIFSHIFE